MHVSQIAVEVRKTVSDREYGNEQVTVRYTVDLDEDDGDPRLRAAAWLATAREQVRSELNQSESLNIRRAINPPRRICNECHEPLPDDVRSYLHPACEEKVRAERDAARETARLERIRESGEDHSGPDDDDEDLSL